ncbi:hypothetical protein K438DRAFT_362417 [Mycena galopus ATCC 62051]|nr:hypothetical protein K438DRAFT_362417 [Mycena galopus ATCC 62051]
MSGGMTFWASSMSDPRIDPDILVSLAAAALMAAEADAAAPDSKLIFRPEWRPTPRTRSSTGTPGANQPLSWTSVVRNLLSRSGLQQNEPSLPPGPHTERRSPPDSDSHSESDAPPETAYARGPQPGSTSVPPPQPELWEDAVTELFERNKDVFDEVFNHPFPRSLGKGTASLDGFRYYMMQDMLYLQTCASLKMIGVGTTFDFKKVNSFGVRHDKSLLYVATAKNTCITTLGIPESTVEAIKPSDELKATNDFYKKSLRIEDGELGYYVVLFPCVLIYYTIAKRLIEDPSTAKSAVYHQAWTVENNDPSSVDKYTEFINGNIAAKGGMARSGMDRWSDIVRKACELEAQIFNTGLQAPAPFEIIPEGIYPIQIYSADSVVLAIQNVKGFLRPPLDKLLGGYFPSNGESAVVGMRKTGGDVEKVRVGMHCSCSSWS